MNRTNFYLSRIQDSTSAASTALQSCLLSNLRERSRKLWAISSMVSALITSPWAFYGVLLCNHAVNQSPLRIGLENGATYLLSDQSPVASAICPLGRKGLSEHRGFAEDLAFVSMLQDGIRVGHGQVGASSPSASPACFPRATITSGLSPCSCLMSQGLQASISSFVGARFKTLDTR